MPARVPLDVDLEDKLLYGLTPTRLAYLVVALLAGFSAWTTPWAPAVVRASPAILIALIGVVAAWGRWRGRPIDEWAMDSVDFLLSEYYVRFDKPRMVKWRRRSER